MLRRSRSVGDQVIGRDGGREYAGCHSSRAYEPVAFFHGLTSTWKGLLGSRKEVLKSFVLVLHHLTRSRIWPILSAQARHAPQPSVFRLFPTQDFAFVQPITCTSSTNSTCIEVSNCYEM